MCRIVALWKKCVLASGLVLAAWCPTDSIWCESLESSTEVEQELVTVEDTVTVTSASRQEESVAEAPVAVTVVSPEQIERLAALGTAPKLFEFLPGVEVTQSGLYEFKLNVRGLNSLANRRVSVLIDGRDPSFPLLDAQEWSSAAFPLDDLEAAELVRGPSSALYGTNAFNGFLNLVTKSAQSQLGGRFRVTAGEQSTQRGEFRIASAISNSLFFKGVGSYTESDEFFRSRNESVEYSQPCTAETGGVDCLMLEVIPLPLDRSKVGYIGGRLESLVGQRAEFVLEGGYGDVEGPFFSSSAGRAQLDGVSRPWARFDLRLGQTSFRTNWTGRKSRGIIANSGTESFNDSERFSAEVQSEGEFWENRGRWVAGASYRHETVNTADREGRETLLSAPQEDNIFAAYGQFEINLGRLELNLAARWDESDLHDGQISPQAALVFDLGRRRTLRFNYRRAFLSPTYPEFFVRVPVAPPLDLSSAEAVCRSGGVSCGFDQPLAQLIVGNENLDVETIETIEAGFNAVLGGRLLLHFDVYRSEIEGFIQAGVPQILPSGRVNPDFGVYQPPQGLSSESAAQLVGHLQESLGVLYPFLSNPNGEPPVLALATLVNFGMVETFGVEIGLDYSIGSRWQFDFNYSWLDFDAEEELPEAPPLVANSPEHKLAAGVTYVGDRFDVALSYRWVDEFRWIEGIFNGTVESYDVFNLAVSLPLKERWRLGLNVSNLLDEEHYEFFSGDLLERQALLHISYDW